MDGIRSALLIPAGILTFLLVLFLSFLIAGAVAAVVALLVMVGAAEMGFRILYRRKSGHPWTMVPKVPFDEMYVEPHPYLPFSNKRNFLTPRESRASYPLNADKGYIFAQYRINDLRYVTGPSGGREIAVPKPEGLVRINCLGASTTGNYLRFQGRDYSYPAELEDILRKEFPGLNIEVNNCGVGGRTTAEILVDFLLLNIDTEPDMVILYHGYNDLLPSMTPGFSPDYSHARRSLGETYAMYRISSLLPYLPLASYNYLLTQVLGGNVRYSLIQAVSRGRPDFQGGFRGTQTYQRNIEHLIQVCRARGIPVVLSTFCHYLYDGVKESPVHRKYHEGVFEENRAVAGLATRYELPLVDNSSLMPQDPVYFVDSIHFSPEGMKRLALNFSVPVIRILRERQELKEREGDPAR
jgi:lysophospholipase L1-like esterase